MAEYAPDDERLGATLKQVVQRSIDEAVRRGASQVEAEHLLLSIRRPMTRQLSRSPSSASTTPPSTSR